VSLGFANSDILSFNNAGRATLWRNEYIILAERSFKFCLVYSMIHHLSSLGFGQEGVEAMSLF
jgi:hypothetical protein